MVVNADGSAEKIYVDFGRATTAQGDTFLTELLSTNTVTNANQITSELEQALNDLMKGTRFKPRTFNGQSLPTMVFVDSHFRSMAKSCIEVESNFKTSQGSFWSAYMRSDEHCYDAPN